MSMKIESIESIEIGTLCIEIGRDQSSIQVNEDREYREYRDWYSLYTDW